jgi:hypothetical protein
MRVLRRHNEVDESPSAEAEVTDTEAAEADRTTTTGERRSFLPGWRRGGVATEERSTGTVETVETDTVDDRDRTEPIATRPATTESEIRIERWSWADAVVSVIGAGMALVGLIALARAGIDRTWYRPVVEVLDANHTAALGAAEVGAGALLVLAGVARSRAAAALVGLAIAVMGALAAIETAEVRRELAIEEWWAWMLAGVGLLVAVVALVPPRRSRVERVLATR